MHKIRKTIAPFLPKSIKRRLKEAVRGVQNGKETVRCFIHKHLNKKKLLQYDKIHIGCGDVHLDNFINIDYRATKAADIAMDCIHLNYFKPQSVALIYSSAFFEHIYRQERVTCLTSCQRILRQDGKVLFLGIPDFYEIAKAYMSKQKGIFHKTFDEFEVYRYTHGNPEQSPEWWLEQLHKSLFDKETLESLLQQAEFTRYCIFNYIYENGGLPLSMGFLAFKSRPNIKIDAKWLYTYIQSVDKNYKDIHDITIKSLRLRYETNPLSCFCSLTPD